MAKIYQNRSLPSVGNPPSTNLLVSLTGGTLIHVLSSSTLIADADAIYKKNRTDFYYRSPYLIQSNVNELQVRGSKYITLSSDYFKRQYLINYNAGYSVNAPVFFTGNNLTKKINVDFTGMTLPTETNILVSTISGTLADHLNHQIDDILVGKNPYNSQFVPLSTVQGFIYPNNWLTNISEPSYYIRNTNLWLSCIDLSFASPYNTSGGNNNAGTLITPRHVALATHWSFGIGTRVHFVDMNNNMQYRTVIGRYSDPDYTDITIVTLNADLTGNIKPVKIFPPAYNFTVGENPVFTSQLIHFTVIKPPLVVTTQDKNFYVAEYTSDAGGSQPSLSSRSPFFYGIRGGDSGSPNFFIINNEASFIFTAHFAGGSSNYNPSWYSSVWGTSYFGYVDYINNIWIPAADASGSLTSGYANSAIWPVSAGRYITQYTCLTSFPVLSSLDNTAYLPSTSTFGTYPFYNSN